MIRIQVEIEFRRIIFPLRDFPQNPGHLYPVPRVRYPPAFGGNQIIRQDNVQLRRSLALCQFKRLLHGYPPRVDHFLVHLPEVLPVSALRALEGFKNNIRFPWLSCFCITVRAFPDSFGYFRADFTRPPNGPFHADEFPDVSRTQIADVCQIGSHKPEFYGVGEFYLLQRLVGDLHKIFRLLEEHVGKICVELVKFVKINNKGFPLIRGLCQSFLVHFL